MVGCLQLHEIFTAAILRITMNYNYSYGARPTIVIPISNFCTHQGWIATSVSLKKKNRTTQLSDVLINSINHACKLNME